MKKRSHTPVPVGPFSSLLLHTLFLEHVFIFDLILDFLCRG